MSVVPDHRRPLRAAALAVLGLSFVPPAHAQYFSKNDGFASNGQWQFQSELMPYAWVPGVAGSLHFDDSRDRSINFNSGIPSASTLAHTLRGAFMGAGLFRYGPFSAEFDLDYVTVNQSSNVPAARPGRANRVNVSTSLVRFAPGLGVEVYQGDIGSVQTIVDVRAGLAVFANGQSLRGEGDLAGLGRSGGDTLVQPWLGTRATFIPAPRWRIMADGIVQGLGVDGGTFGWGAALIGSYAVTDSMNVSLGFRALESARAKAPGDLPGSSRRSFSILAYGPLIGVGFRF